MNNSFDYMCKYYGIQPMSLKEEFDLPVNKKRTRNNKIKMIDTIELAKKTLDYMETRVRHIPEVDDDVHSILVQEFREKVDEMCDCIDETYCFNG